MTSLRRLFKQPLRQLPNSLVIAVLVVAILGFADATYLTVEHYRNAIPPCTTSGCETVLTSAYATVFGVPLSLVGALYYFVVLIGAFAYFEGRHEKLFKIGLFLVIVGFIVSLFLLYLQAFVIHSFCQYCLGSLAITTVLAILSVVIFRKYSAAPDENV
jgi:uncharacterized membrane protein